MKDNILLKELTDKFKTVNIVRNLAINYDKDLLNYILNESQHKNEFKSLFFIDIDNFSIFKKEDFITFLDIRTLDSSYTRYSNKIGLSINANKMLKATEEIVLNFPYKDCMLKGSQTKDDQKSQEIFFNDILGKDEIDVLLKPKAFTNIKVYGEVSNKENIFEDSNLLIKGNNLLALHSLKEKYANKVKLIYIDPPYNTGNDSFKYNDRFNHSTWLTFMKNRLEIAREFLIDDGIICIQCDDNEQVYLGILCDEIFGIENRINTLVIEMASTGGNKRTHKENHFLKTKEYILVYSKGNFSKLNCIYDEVKELDKHFNIFFDGKTYSSLSKIISEKFPTVKWSDYLKNANVYNFLIENKDNIYQTDGHGVSSWVLDNDVTHTLLYKKEDVEIYKAEKDDKIEIYKKSYGPKNDKAKMQPLSLKIELINDLEKISILRSDIWKGFYKDMGNLNKEGGIILKNGKKPERLISDIIKSFSDENDIFLDFFIGSGTSCAVAHKMKRRYIGVEQMDYIKDVTIERLVKVIDGEQNGISKHVNWQGGGGFVYVELMPLNNVYKEKILNIHSDEELKSIYEDLKIKAFIDYRVDIDSILEGREFSELSFDDKKKLLYNVLDSNMDYLPYDEIEDKTYNIDSEIIKLNKQFYGE